MDAAIVLQLGAAACLGASLLLGRRTPIGHLRETGAELQALADNVPGALFQFRLWPDGHADLPFASAGLIDLFGCRPQQALISARPLIDALLPDDVGRVRQGLFASAETLLPWHDTFRTRHPQRGERWVEGHATPTRHADGSITWHGHVRDVTELHRSRERLRLAASVFDVCQEGIMVTDAERRIIDVNPAFSRITGYSRAEALGHTPAMLQSDRHDRGFYAAMDRALAREGRWNGEVWNRRKTGEVYAELLSISTVPDDSGGIGHYVAIFSDISGIKAHQQELDRIAHYDPLTSVPNRRLLGDRMTQALAEARRTGQRLAVCMMDLDGFKPVNDTLGHEAGDRLLIEIARRLTRVMRAGETVARLGGDEFVLILRDVRSLAVFERVLQTVGAPVTLPHGVVRVSASLGITYFQGGDADGDQLLREADHALYQAKACGRDRFAVFEADAPEAQAA